MKQKFCNEKLEKRGYSINRFQSGTSYNGEFERDIFQWRTALYFSEQFKRKRMLVWMSLVTVH